MITSHLKTKATRIATRAAFGGIGGVLVLTGAGFLTAAGMILLAQVLGWPVALSVMGLAFVGVGLIVIAIGRSGTMNAQPPHTQHEDPAALVQAFLEGVKTGSAARARH